LTEVFEKKTLQSCTQYKTIASERIVVAGVYAIQTVGETLIFFNKKFSHAVNKKPVPGDFRIQVQFGGIYRLVHPDAELIEAQNC
jgi:hypothetical protein